VRLAFSRRPWLLLPIALGLGALAGSWYFATRGETVGSEQDTGAVGFQRGDPKRPLEERRTPGRVTTTSGLQNTVPETVGYDEQTAIFTVEEAGFRVRVMNRRVSDSSDEGIVVQQLPRGGLTRRVSWIVTIVVGRLR
jgi:PASTA domain